MKHLSIFIFSLAFLLCGTCANAQTVQFEVVYDFNDNAQMAVGAPQGPMIQASDGNFYLVTSSSDGPIVRVTPGGVPSISPCPHGGECVALAPRGPLFEGTDGAFYGTSVGGVNGDDLVFRLSNEGSFSTLHTSCSETDCADGQVMDGVIEGTDKNFYGIAYYGVNEGGVVYQLTAGGTYKVLHSFCSAGGSSCTDGSGPIGQLVQASDDNFYGVTTDGGLYGDGTVYRVSASGDFAVVFSFCSTCASGTTPMQGLVEGSDGRLYGTTTAGGAGSRGSLFAVSPDGSEQTIYAFCSGGAATQQCTDDGPPFNVLLGSDGNFYGTTAQGGSTDVYGSIFRITPAGDMTTLHAFCTAQSRDECPDGSETELAPVQGADGSLWGVTYEGGTNGQGVIYTLSASPALKAPVQIFASPSTVPAGGQLSIQYSVLNGYSKTFRQCYRSSTAAGSAWAGELTASASPAIASVAAPVSAGTYSYSFTCGGSESSMVSVNITAASTSTALAVSPDSAVSGQNVTATATVTKTEGSGTPAGNVTFSVAGMTLATVPVDGSGVATLNAPTSGVAAGTYPLIATYSGDSGDLKSTSNTVNVAIAPKYTTSVALTVSPNPVTEPAMATATATISRSGATGTPTGTVTFYASGKNLGTFNVNSSGETIFSTSTGGQVKGIYSVTAVYSGDAVDSGSTSPAVQVKLD